MIAFNIVILACPVRRELWGPTRVLKMLFLFLCLAVAPAFAVETLEEDKCAQGTVQDSSGICVEPGNNLLQLNPQGSGLLLPPSPGHKSSSRAAAQAKAGPDRGDQTAMAFTVYFFWGTGCPHCEQEKKFLSEVQKKYPTMDLRTYEVWYNKQNAALLSAMLQGRGMRVSGVPTTFIGEQVFTGFTNQTEHALEDAIRTCRLMPCRDPGTVLNKEGSGEAQSNFPAPSVSEGAPVPRDKGTSVDIPLFGKLDARGTSLPIMTLVIAGLDSFNPCAFFVLLSLLGLLVHARSRNKMLLIGGVFVFFSGFIYFLFMAAWLNLFLFMGQVTVITTIAGGISVIIAGINIKDFFMFKQGLSLTIPDSAKPGLFDRMRRLMRATSLPSILVGTTVLAIVANSYELLCTAGFPMVFTRILTLQHLSTTTYYLYLVLYNIVYVIPLLIIVLAFTITLGSRKLSEWQGRVLKLISGTMMLGLGGVLLVNPALLNSVTISMMILVGALVVSMLVATMTRRLGY